MIVSTFEHQQKEKKQSKKKYWIIALIAFLFITASLIGFVAYKVFAFSNKVFKSQGLKNDIISFLPLPNKGYTSDIAKDIQQKKNFSILLLGYGGAGHDGAYLTDSIMLIQVNPTLQNLSLISIPRDMWVQIPESTTQSPYGKINSAYAIGVDDTGYPYKASKYQGKYGGGTMAKDVISNVLGVPVNYVVSINFEGFKTIVDDLGGIDVTVDHTLDDYYYPSGDNTTNGPVCSAPMNTPTSCRYWHIHFDPGLQHMNGEEALEFTRSRHAEGAEGSDFARSQRQQKVIEAIKQKAKVSNVLPKVLDILNTIQNNVLTDMSLADIKDLANTISTWNLNSIDKEALTDENFLKATYSNDGQYILIPRIGIGNYTDIQSFIQQIPEKMILAKEAQDETIGIENKTGYISPVATVQSTLTNIGLHTIAITPSAPLTISNTVIYDFSNGKYPQTLSYLKNNVSANIVSDTTIPNPQNVSFLMVLGSDLQMK